MLQSDDLLGLSPKEAMAKIEADVKEHGYSARTQRLLDEVLELDSPDDVSDQERDAFSRMNGQS